MAGMMGDDEVLVVAEEFSTLNAGDGYGGLAPNVAYKAEFEPEWSEVAQQRNYNSMCNELPPDKKIRKYRVSAKNGAVMRNGMSLKTELVLQGALGPVPRVFRRHVFVLDSIASDE